MAFEDGRLELGLKDDLSPFNLPLSFILALFEDDERKGRQYVSHCYTATPIHSFTCHSESHMLT